MTRAAKGVRLQLVRWNVNVGAVDGAWKVCSTTGNGSDQSKADETQLAGQGRLYQTERHLHRDLMIAIQ